ncbi:DNA topoisomerase [Flexibacterium corallicola]|uniref:DNA topoisomerase n=1 Tax=Flexibacterium corallicola TaxID=3037259 RepID=UPI00286EDE4B|nr:DNA topoisomerase [Pseudovibrio sp. M1P-2-3]
MPNLQPGTPIHRGPTDILSKMTRTPQRFTEATLLAAMEHISKFVTDAEQRQILDKTAGLGTAATRATILDAAITKGYFLRKNTVLLPTPKARGLVAVVPKALAAAGVTALWEQTLDEIGRGTTCDTQFMSDIDTWVRELTQEQLQAFRHDPDHYKATFLRTFNAYAPSFTCESCAAPLQEFWDAGVSSWLCTNSNSNCKRRYMDGTGAVHSAASTPPCPECGGATQLRQSQSNGRRRQFWGCRSYPKCSGIVPHARSRA